MKKDLNSKSGYYSLVLRFISTRDRSSQEIKEFLTKKGADPEFIQEVIRKLQDERLLDDGRFASNRIYFRMTHKLWRINRITSELLIFGIHKEIIKSELSKITKEAWLSNCNKLIQKKVKFPLSKEALPKLHRQLRSYGYLDTEIKNCLKNLHSSLEAE